VKLRAGTPKDMRMAPGGQHSLSPRAPGGPQRAAAKRSDGAQHFALLLRGIARGGAPRAERRQRLGRCKPAQRLPNDAPMGLARRYKLLPSRDCRRSRPKPQFRRAALKNRAMAPGLQRAPFPRGHCRRGLTEPELCRAARNDQPVPLRRLPVRYPCHKRVCHCTVA